MGLWKLCHILRLDRELTEGRQSRQLSVPFTFQLYCFCCKADELDKAEAVQAGGDDIQYFHQIVKSRA